jgi:uncharacterized protein YqjF (DUF2071 family)
MDVQAEPVTPQPTRAIGRTVLTQRWEWLTFLHWAVEPERVRTYLPPTVRPDQIDGVTYVGLVPFVMRGIGVWGGPGLPYVGTFCETNVRLYSVDRRGRRGVVFVTLDASRLAPVVAARWGPQLPYMWSRMRCTWTADRIRYRCRRRWPSPAGASSDIEVRMGDPVAAGPLEHFLTARWGLHLQRGRHAMYWPNSHETWPLHAATVEKLDDELLAAAGFADLGARSPDSVLFSPGVHARFGPRVRA